MADEDQDDPPRSASAMLGLLYMVGGTAMVLIAAMLGYGSIVGWSLSLALLVVGITGIGAGGYIVWRSIRER